MAEDTGHVHTPGPPWTVYRKFQTYSDANDARHQLLLETDELQVKVHRIQTPRKEFFAVKTRVHPDIAAAKKSNRRRGGKKRRNERSRKND